jgi:hypothetical protein
MKQETVQRSKCDKNKNTISTYNEYKEFQGRKYTGMKVGRSHNIKVNGKRKK